MNLVILVISAVIGRNLVRWIAETREQRRLESARSVKVLRRFA